MADIVVKHDQAGQLDLQQKIFEFQCRKAEFLANSNLVPSQYRRIIEVKGKNGSSYQENPSALANCFIAMDVARRVGISEMEVMQNLFVIEGKPTWSSQWLIGAINSCGKFSEDLQFYHKDLGETEVEYTSLEWNNGNRNVVKKKIKIHNRSCYAFTVSAINGKEVKSPTISVEMAVKEGWYQKNGSKWQTMTELMLEYRSASFFASTRCPEVKQGLRTKEEEEDILEAVKGDDNTYTVEVKKEEKQKESKTDELKNKLKKSKVEEAIKDSEIIVDVDQAISAKKDDGVYEKNTDGYTGLDAAYDESADPELMLDQLTKEAQDAGEYSFD